MKRSPWFPVWAGFQDDEAFLMVSAEAELLYFRGVARCKLQGQGSDGGTVSRHQLRRLCDKMETDPTALASELCEAGLWARSDDGDWTIAAYGDWNRSAEDERQARSDSGKRANHARWGHKGRWEACPKCHPDVSPGESGRSPGGVQTDIRAESDRSPKVSLVDGDRDGDGDETTTASPVDNQGGAEPEDLAVVDLADSLIAKMGYADELAAPDERRYVARALKLSITADELTDLAVEAISRPNVEDPRAWFRGALKARVNELSGPAARAQAAAPAVSAALGGPIPMVGQRAPERDDDWSTQWGFLTVGARSHLANKTALDAWHEIRMVRKYQKAEDAKWAFRDAYKALSAGVSA